MARLTDQEQQEIIRFLEADKPLPDHYRFLLFDDKREVELVWNGKTNEVCNVVLPFQTIEHVDEPRWEKGEADQDSGFGELFDPRGRQLSGWTNKLIWGDNKLILSSLKNGPLRDEIEKQGGLKLIYIDPPFDVGADFSMDIEVGDPSTGSGQHTFTKRPNILEEIAYRDTWGKGADSFIAMIYERLILMRDLLAEDGSIYVHCDWRVNSYLRLALDEVFGKERHTNEIIWLYKTGGASKDRWAKKHDMLLLYTKGDSWIFNPQKERSYMMHKYGFKKSEFQIDPATGLQYSMVYARDVWDIPSVGSETAERVGFPTQKPELLVERIIKGSSNPGDLVADFFVGSGTTAAVAEKLGRKWIATDLGKFAIHTTRKRMIGVQRKLKGEGKDFRAFEILNLGRYERQHYVGVPSTGSGQGNLREDQKQQMIEAKEAAFLELILRAYRAEKVEGYPAFHGKKAGRLVAVGPVNLPVTRLFVEEIIVECRKKNITRCDILGFEFEMGLFPNVLDEARAKGIDIAPKYIPAEVFDKRAVEKNQVVFHDVSFIEVKPIVKQSGTGFQPVTGSAKHGQDAHATWTVAVELTDFSVFYSQDSIKAAEAALGDKKKAGSKIVVEKGQIVKVTKNAKGVVTREVLTEKWTDWVDYWAVDFDYESKREIIRVKDDESGEVREQWTGDYVFENEWQSFRTKKDRTLELTSVYHECAPGRRKIAVKVVDIFGNDTMTIVDVRV